MPPRNWRALIPRRKQADAPRVPHHRHPKLAHRVVRLERGRVRIRRRVVALEEGLLEQRRLSLRVAELTDLVTELIGAAARGEDEFRRVLAKLDPTDEPEPDRGHDA